MQLKSLCLSLFYLTSIASASSNGSPICSVPRSDSKIAAGMGQNERDLRGEYSISVSGHTAVPGRVVTVLINGTSGFQGLLMYATDGKNSKNRIGTWLLKKGVKAASSCDAFNLQDSNSVITHTAGAKFSKRSKFNFRVPTKGFDKEIVFHAIVLRTEPSGGFSWGVFNDMVSLRGSANRQSSGGCMRNYVGLFLALGIIILST